MPLLGFKRRALHGDDPIPYTDALELAQRDGFDTPAELASWFEVVHGLPFRGEPFRGTLIRWHLQR